MKRINKKFQELKTENRKAFIAYICAGDPDFTTSLAILQNLPAAGVDIIELGIAFLDPAGDGPIIESASKRAIKGGISLKKTLQMVEIFRKKDEKTPIILMGYYNNFLKYGIDKFFFDAQKSGADGILIVDLPMEERDEIHAQITKTNIDLISLIAPLTSEERIKKIADEKYSSGFLYMISMLGITGTKQAVAKDNKENIAKIRKNSKLPIAIGFGIQTPQQAQEFVKIDVDAIVVGSAIVKEIADMKDVKKIMKKVEEFSNAIKNKL
ncbi:MAG TPA: tryptophan synthase subunit alpha [Rickettsiales bacterium]|nr:tryptophan synthase subunit alpha [Rickettsiales bacterium]